MSSAERLSDRWAGTVEQLPVADGKLVLYRRSFGPAADRWLSSLRSGVPWRQEFVQLFGRRTPVPRLLAYCGDPGTCYRYSGIVHQPLPWSSLLAQIRRLVQDLSGADFNSALLNLYRDGRDSIGWHSDDEPELGPEPLIASLSLGASRRFELRRSGGKQRLRLDLEHGSLLVMGGALQHHWQHRLARQPEVTAVRINITWRLLHSTADGDRDPA